LRVHTLLERANSLLEAADKLDDATANLHAFRSFLENLNARTPIVLPPPHLQAIAVVRAGLLRSAIALIVAILDSQGSDRASLGQISETFKDKTFVQFLANTLYKGRGAVIDEQILQDLCDRHHQIYTSPQFKRVRQLRHDEIGHILIRETPAETVDYADTFALADEIEYQVIMSHEGLGILTPNFIDERKNTDARATMFWDTYLAAAQ
jgi:hypothetical protein